MRFRTLTVILAVLIVAGLAVPATAQSVLPPVISGWRDSATIPLNGAGSYQVSVNNPNSGTTLSGVSFSVTMPAGIVITGSPIGLPGFINFCGGTVSITSTGIIGSGWTIGPGSGCSAMSSFTGTTPGIKLITTSSVSSNEGGSGAPSTVQVSVGDPTGIPVLSPAALLVLAVALGGAAMVALRRTV
jgi:hypothetical protein